MAQNVTRAGDRQNLRQQRARFRAARFVDLEQLSGMKISGSPVRPDASRALRTTSKPQRE
jgi:hypothetical protein